MHLGWCPQVTAGSKPEQPSIIWACIFFIRGIAVVVGPPISGILYGIRKSQGVHIGYEGYGFMAMEVFVGACAVAASLSSIMMVLTRRKVQDWLFGLSSTRDSPFEVASHRVAQSRELMNWRGWRNC